MRRHGQGEVVAVKSGRQMAGVASFEEFYPEAHDAVFRALVLTVGDPELTADAVQEALARALARWDVVATYDNPTGWVYRVALNWTRSQFRRRAREFLMGRPPDRPGAPVPEPIDTRVTNAVAELPVGQRAVVVLRLYLDWPVEQVAAALGVSPGTVKSRQSRALARLRDRLEVQT